LNTRTLLTHLQRGLSTLVQKKKFICPERLNYVCSCPDCPVELANQINSRASQIAAGIALIALGKAIINNLPLITSTYQGLKYKTLTEEFIKGRFAKEVKHRINFS
jgi:hypothetical protein